jgi:hypothetical protein
MLAEPLHLRPFENDLKIARACAQIATPTIERSLKILSSLADERAMLVIAAAVWLASRYCKRGEDREETDTMLASVLVAGVMPDLFKFLVRRGVPTAQSEVVETAFPIQEMPGIRSPPDMLFTSAR